MTCVTPHQIYDVVCAEASVALDTYMLLRHATLGPPTMRVLLSDASGRLGDRPLRRTSERLRPQTTSGNAHLGGHSRAYAA